MIIVLRGCPGSGKSYPVYRLLADYPGKPVYFPPGRLPNNRKTVEMLVGYNVGDKDIFVCGSYEPGARCGGADRWMAGVEKVHIPFLRQVKANGYKHVIYECFQGSVSSPKHWMNFVLRDDCPDHVVFLQLDTTFEQVEAQVKARHDAGPRANIPMNPKTIPSNYKASWSVHRHLLDAGLDAREIPRDHSYETLLSTLRAGGWST